MRNNMTYNAKKRFVLECIHDLLVPLVIVPLVSILYFAYGTYLTLIYDDVTQIILTTICLMPVLFGLAVLNEHCVSKKIKALDSDYDCANDPFCTNTATWD